MHTPVNNFYKMPWHLTMGYYNELKKVKKEEAEAQKKAEEEAKASQSMSMPSIPNFSMPKFN